MIVWRRRADADVFTKNVEIEHRADQPAARIQAVVQGEEQAAFVRLRRRRIKPSFLQDTADGHQGFAVRMRYLANLIPEFLALGLHPSDEFLNLAADGRLRLWLTSCFAQGR